MIIIADNNTILAYSRKILIVFYKQVLLKFIQSKIQSLLCIHFRVTTNIRWRILKFHYQAIPRQWTNRWRKSTRNGATGLVDLTSCSRCWDTLLDWGMFGGSLICVITTEAVSHFIEIDSLLVSYAQST